VQRSRHKISPVLKIFGVAVVVSLVGVEKFRSPYLARGQRPLLLFVDDVARRCWCSNQINRSRTIEIPSNYHFWWASSERSFCVSFCPGRPRWCAIMAGPPRVEYMVSVGAVVHPDSNLASLSWPVATLSRKATTEFQLDEDVSWPTCCYCCWTMTSVWWAVDGARPEFGISHRTDDTCERQSTCNIIGRLQFSYAGGRPGVVAIELTWLSARAAVKVNHN
jgi:hypothetical protein